MRCCDGDVAATVTAAACLQLGRRSRAQHEAISPVRKTWPKPPPRRRWRARAPRSPRSTAPKTSGASTPVVNEVVAGARPSRRPGRSTTKQRSKKIDEPAGQGEVEAARRPPSRPSDTTIDAAARHARQRRRRRRAGCGRDRRELVGVRRSYAASPPASVAGVDVRRLLVEQRVGHRRWSGSMAIVVDERGVDCRRLAVDWSSTRLGRP